MRGDAYDLPEMSQTPHDPGERPPDTGSAPEEPVKPPEALRPPGGAPAPPAPQPVQPPIRTGVTLGRNQVQEYLGHRAYDPNLSRSTTIEVLEALRDQDVRGRLAAAAPRLVELHHPNLVDVYEVGERQGVPYLVSAYVEG